MAQQYITRTYTDENGEDHEMLEVQFPDLGPVTGRPWYVCMSCGFPFKEADVQFIGGKPYCLKNDCYRHKSEERSPQTSVL